jgi:hypothetical protein
MSGPLARNVHVIFHPGRGDSFASILGRFSQRNFGRRLNGGGQLAARLSRSLTCQHPRSAVARFVQSPIGSGLPKLPHDGF